MDPRTKTASPWTRTASKPLDENGERDLDETEGWESMAEEPVQSLAANPELEAALREASEAIDEDGHVKGP